MTEEKARDILWELVTEHRNMFSETFIEAISQGLLSLEKQIPKKVKRMYEWRTGEDLSYKSEPRPVKKGLDGKDDDEDWIIAHGNWVDLCPTCERVLIKRVTDKNGSTPYVYNSTSRCLCGQLLDRESE